MTSGGGGPRSFGRKLLSRNHVSADKEIEIPKFPRVAVAGPARRVRMTGMGAASGKRGPDPAPYKIKQANLKLAEVANEALKELAKKARLTQPLYVTSLLARELGVDPKLLLRSLDQEALPESA